MDTGPGIFDSQKFLGFKNPIVEKKYPEIFYLTLSSANELRYFENPGVDI